MPFECKYILWSCINVDKLNFANEILLIVLYFFFPLRVIVWTTFLYISLQSIDIVINVCESSFICRIDIIRQQHHSFSHWTTKTNGFLINWPFSGHTLQYIWMCTSFWPINASYTYMQVSTAGQIRIIDEQNR